jgi:titin
VWWERPSFDGDSPIVNYVLQYSDNNGQTWMTVPRNESTAKSWALVNLAADASYVFRVAAVNSAGSGLPSAQSLPTTPGAAMPVPSNLAVTAGSGWVSLSWTFASTNGRAVDGYVVHYSSDGGRKWTTYQYGGGVVAQNTLVVSGLSTRLTYVFRVAALGRGERGDWSQISRSVVPVPLAAAPIRVLGRAMVNRNSRDGAVYLAWTPPRNAGNSRIIGYQIQYSTGLNGLWSTATNILSAGTRATIRGLTGGIPYTFRVAAITREGVGPFSVASSKISPFVSPVPQRR